MSINDLDKLIEEIIKEASGGPVIADIWGKREDGEYIPKSDAGNRELVGASTIRKKIKDFFQLDALPDQLGKLPERSVAGFKNKQKGVHAFAAIAGPQNIINYLDFNTAFSYGTTNKAFLAANEILLKTKNEEAYNELLKMALYHKKDFYTKPRPRPDQPDQPPLPPLISTSEINVRKAKSQSQKQKLRTQQKQYFASLQAVAQEFPPDYESEELASLKSDEDLAKGTIRFIDSYLKTDFTKTPNSKQFKTLAKYMNSENVIDTTRKLLAADAGFSDEKREKLSSILRMAKIFDTSTLDNLASDEERNKVLLYAFVRANANLPPVEGISLKDPSLKIQDLESDENIKKDVFSKLSLDSLGLADPAKEALKVIFKNAFASKNIREGLILEEIDIEALLNLDQQEIYSKIQSKEIDSEQFKDALKMVYKAVQNDIDFTFGADDKRKILNFISNLFRATDYYASGRQVRTKRGATTGWKVGTAQASGTARIDKEVEDMMRKAGGGDSKEGIRQKLINYSKFLDNVNNIVSKDAKFDKQNTKIDTLFSQFVGLEILNDNLFQMEEASVKGNLFEAFLALICGGTQIGGELGGADYVYDIEKNGKLEPVNGSSKLINSTKFKQAKTNLEDPMEYVIAIKYIKTETGELKQAGKDDKIRFVKIYIVYSDMKKEPPTDGDNEDETKAKAYIGKDLNNLTIEGRNAGTEVEFDMKTLMNSCYVCDFDFSFLEKTEFSDVSTKIMNKINAQVEKAFSSLTNLRDNITRWVSDKDLIAANQVKSNQQDLTDAIEGMEKDDELKTSELSESMKQLDKLILEILKESLDK